MNPLTIALAVVLLSLPIGQTSRKHPGPSNFLEEAGAMQSKLNQWRQTLSGMNLNSLPVNARARNLLERERSSCLTRIDTLDREIAAMQSNQTLAGEMQLVLDARRFAGEASALHDSLGAFVSLSLRLGDMSVVQRWMLLESKIGSMGSYLDEGQLIRQLDTIGASARPAAAKPQLPGEISGHVYRADTGKPLAGVRVMLGRASSSISAPFHSVETSARGSYIFSNVRPGSYKIGAYVNGFTRGRYLGNLPPHTGWETLRLASGEKLTGIDMRLHPLVSVTQMNEEALVAAFGGGRFWLRFGPGHFSPDRKLFGFFVNSDSKQVWVYDLKSRLLTPVISRPPHGFGGTTIAWVGGTLYTEYTRGAGADRYFAWTPKGIRQIPDLPAAAKAALDQASERQSGTVSTGRLTVSAVSPTCYHCTGVNLMARPAGGGKPFMIAGGSWELGSFAVEDHGSLVLFPRFTYPAIAMFDLNTHRVREAYLPNRAERLLVARPEPGSYFVAYTSYGPCQGYGDQGGLYPIFVPRRPYNVCFASIPLEGKK